MENKVLATIAGVEIKESDLNAIIMSKLRRNSKSFFIKYKM